MDMTTTSSFRIRAAALAAALLAAPVAEGAAPVVTPLLFRGSAVHAICRVLNAGTQPADVLIEIVDGLGTRVSSLQFDQLAPGSSIDWPQSPAPAVAYCRVSGISSKKTRV